MIENDKLIVFERFMIDYELPKHAKKRDEDSGDNSGNNFSMHPRFNVTVGGSDAIVIRSNPRHRSKLSLWQRFFTFWRPSSPIEPEPQMTIEAFFGSVKNSADELKVVHERAAGYERAIVNARNAGQRALLEQLEGGLNAHRMETQLLALGLPKSITEENVVKFYKLCKKGLRLDWVANFARTIPEEILAKKLRADAVGIFDNYVVMHYDPDGKSFAETELEKANRRDPILFGVMEHRRVLYFIGDWIDDLCDLTLDQIAEVIGKNGISVIRTNIHPYRENEV